MKVKNKYTKEQFFRKAILVEHSSALRSEFENYN